MTGRPLIRRTAAAVAALTSLPLLAAGCGGDSGDTSSGTGDGGNSTALPSVAADDALAAMAAMIESKGAVSNCASRPSFWATSVNRSTSNPTIVSPSSAMNSLGA